MQSVPCAASARETCQPLPGKKSEMPSLMAWKSYSLFLPMLAERIVARCSYCLSGREKDPRTRLTSLGGLQPFSFNRKINRK